MGEEIEEVCPICANPFQFYGVGPCNHPICHICCLRLRALYQKKECAMCKTECEQAILTSNPTKQFQEYRLQSLKRDKRHMTYFETLDIHQEAMRLLSYKCPEQECGAVCSGGWQDLMAHVKKHHKKYICDLCMTFKKQFAHELTLYTSEQLQVHKKTGDPDDQSFKGHPSCGFCSEYYYSYDELYEHCREKHEQCFICQRNGVRNQYFANYTTLTQHFNHEHFPCMEPECLEQKFVVFGSEIDLQGHVLEKHVSAKEKSKGIPLNIEFNYAGPSTTKRSAEHARKKRQEAREEEAGESSSGDAFRNLQASRLRAPENFGSQLSTPSSSTGNFGSFAPRPSVGAQPQATYEPTPRELLTEELFLTVAQSDIFIDGGIELMNSIKKLFPDEMTLKRLKLAFWSFKNGMSNVEKLLTDYLQLGTDANPNRNPKNLDSELGSIWHRISDLFPEDPLMLQTYDALAKKSKKKGLSIQEFETMKNCEPKRTAMFRMWNDHRAKVQQEAQDKESLPRPAGWNTNNVPKPKKANVVVIKPVPRKDIVGGSTWATRVDAQPATRPISPAGSQSLLNTASSSRANSAAALSEDQFPTLGGSSPSLPQPKPQPTKVAPRVRNDRNDFPTLAAPSRSTTDPKKPIVGRIVSKSKK